MEAAVRKKLYEAMFLVDSAQASDWDKVVATLETVLKKADSEIVSIRKWDDRKLAYEIKGKTRGTYILCYFRADGEKVQEVEKAVQLSEQIMRVLVLSAEGREKEDIEKDTPAMKAEKQKGAQESVEKVEAEQISGKEQVKEAVKSLG
jgi:small subunit ribosomal protein S6